MNKNYFLSGLWNVTCDSCSLKIKSNTAKRRWDGFIVCPTCYEERHQQDFVKAKIDKISVPFARPIPEYIFTDVTYACTADGVTSVAGMAVAGCSITGKNK